MIIQIQPYISEEAGSISGSFDVCFLPVSEEPGVQEEAERQRATDSDSPAAVKRKASSSSSSVGSSPVNESGSETSPPSVLQVVTSSSTSSPPAAASSSPVPSTSSPPPLPPSSPPPPPTAQDWDSAKEEVAKRTDTLEDMLLESRQFEEMRAEFQRWITQIQEECQAQTAVGRTPDVIEKQLHQHKVSVYHPLHPLQHPQPHPH